MRHWHVDPYIFPMAYTGMGYGRSATSKATFRQKAMAAQCCMLGYPIAYELARITQPQLAAIRCLLCKHCNSYPRKILIELFCAPSTSRLRQSILRKVI